MKGPCCAKSFHQLTLGSDMNQGLYGPNPREVQNRLKWPLCFMGHSNPCRPPDRRSARRHPRPSRTPEEQRSQPNLGAWFGSIEKPNSRALWETSAPFTNGVPMEPSQTRSVDFERGGRFAGSKSQKGGRPKKFVGEPLFYWYSAGNEGMNLGGPRKENKGGL